MREEPPSPFQLRVKAGAAILTAAAAAALLLLDWDANASRAPLGPTENVFSGIRPAIKRALNALYGVPPKHPSAGAAAGSIDSSPPRER